MLVFANMLLPLLPPPVANIEYYNSSHTGVCWDKFRASKSSKEIDSVLGPFHDGNASISKCQSQSGQEELNLLIGLLGEDDRE